MRLPRGLTCDSCIIEVLWRTEKGKQSLCSDVMILGGLEVAECIGLCQHGGVCSNGRCVCSEDYYGSNCQYRNENVKAKGPV